MKIPQEYSLLIIIGLFIFGYLLDLLVTPLVISFNSPYLYFTPEYIALFPFSFFSIVVKALAVFLAPLWLGSFISNTGFSKPSVLLFISALLQLYSVQDIASRSQLIPIEWSLSFTLAGAMLILPTSFMFIRAFIISVHKNVTSDAMIKAIKQAQEESINK